MMHKYNKYILLLLFTCFSSILFGQITINELSARNFSTIPDEFSEYEDWIELYNNTDTTVNILSWGISDDKDTIKFRFPSYNLEAHNHLLLMASGRNLNHIINHWETAIFAEDEWKYLVPFQTVNPEWNTLQFDDTKWEEGQGGFGHANGDDNTILHDTVFTVYIRKKFTIADSSLIEDAILHVDYDDAFIAYINGQEVARSNVGCPDVPAAYTTLAANIHYAQMYQGGYPEKFLIPKEELSSLLKNGENILAIQGLNAWHNNSTSSLIPFLSFGIKDTTTLFSPTPEWFNASQNYFHTNFKLSGESETTYLFSPDSIIIDTLSYNTILQTNHSIGCLPDGASTKGYFSSPTPGYENSDGEANYTTAPFFTLESGFFESQQIVYILTNMFESTIRYTIDGSLPDESSPIYTGMLNIDTTLVLRARVFVDNFLPGEVISKSYFINEETELPIVSLITDPDNFFDWETGIYVKGPNASNNFPYYGANFWNDWEKPAYFEFFENNHQKVIGQNIGVKIHGSVSRGYDMKSLRINARGVYGKSRLNYKFFPNKDITAFKKLVLRNSGQDFNRSHFRDGLMNINVREETDNDIMDYRPAVLFINGQYWGVHNIREKIGSDYTEENHGVDSDNIDLLMDNIITIDGDYTHYWHMVEFLKSQMNFNEASYDSLSKLLDIKNYTDYFMTEMYYKNQDWPNNNIKYWRPKTENGKWRYIMFDLDAGLGMAGSTSYNELNRILHGNIQWTYNHKILRKLLQYNNYKKYFINRYADLLNTKFTPEHLNSKIDSIVNILDNEMPRHFEKWGSSMNSWYYEINKITNFVSFRGNYQRQHIKEEFNLVDTVSVVLNTQPQNSGRINISTITPKNYPWSGIYFNGNSVPIKAIPEEGYLFSHWDSTAIIPDTLTPELLLNLDTIYHLTANFIEDTVNHQIKNLTISEINYKSSDELDAGDWFELYNYNSDTLDISGFEFKDSNNSNSFIIANETKILPDSFLVVVQDLEKFTAIYPEVNNITGPFLFGLSSSEERLRLYSPDNTLQIDMTYRNELPFPTNVSATGRTLELDNIEGDLNNGFNWFAGCIGGSPGKGYVECENNTDGLQNIFSEIVSQTILVFPNPTKENITIVIPTTKKGFKCRLYNIYGDLVLQNNSLINTSTTISLKNLKPGIYILDIYNSQERVREKIIVQ